MWLAGLQCYCTILCCTLLCCTTLYRYVDCTTPCCTRLYCIKFTVVWLSVLYLDVTCFDRPVGSRLIYISCLFALHPLAGKNGCGDPAVPLDC